MPSSARSAPITRRAAGWTTRMRLDLARGSPLGHSLTHVNPVASRRRARSGLEELRTRSRLEGPRFVFGEPPFHLEGRRFLFEQPRSLLDGPGFLVLRPRSLDEG